MKRICLFLVFFFSLPAVSGAAEDFSGAERSFLEGDWRTAAGGYEALAAKKPTVEILNRLGDALLYAGDYGASLAAYRKALALAANPDSIIAVALLDAMADGKNLKALLKMTDAYAENPGAWRAVGIFGMLNSYEDRAIYYFYRATEIDPRDYMSYFYIGSIYEIRHQYDEAMKAYKKSVDINPRFAMALNNLGYCYKERQYYTYAVEMYLKALQIRPDDAGFHYNLGNAYAHKGMIKESFESYKRALALEPAFAKAHYNLGRTYIKMGMLEAAKKELEIYLKLWNRSISERDAPPPMAVNEMIEELETLIEQRKLEGN